VLRLLDEMMCELSVGGGSVKFRWSLSDREKLKRQ
jgi:hypothetical protein